MGFIGSGRLRRPSRESPRQGQGIGDRIRFRVFEQYVDPGFSARQKAQEQGQVELSRSRRKGPVFFAGDHAEILEVYRDDPVPEGVQGFQEKRFLRARNAGKGDKVHRVPNDPQGRGGHAPQEFRHSRDGMDGMLVRHGLNAHDRAGSLRDADEPSDRFGKLVKGPFPRGIRVPGTIGIEGAGLGPHDRATEVAGVAQVFLEPPERRFPFPRVRMDRVYIAAEDRYGDIPGGEGVPYRTGGPGTERARVAVEIREGLGEGELYRRGVMGGEGVRENAGGESAEIVGPESELQHKRQCIGEGAESKAQGERGMIVHVSDFLGTPRISGRDHSDAFAAALERLRSAGGGTLVVDPGPWHTGPLELFSDVELRLEEGARLSFIPEPELYRPVFTRWEGVECYAMHPCLFARESRNVSVTGKGTLDGNGSAWWELLRAKRGRGQSAPESPIETRLAELNGGYLRQPGGGGGREIQFLRPPLIQFLGCSNVRVEDVTVLNSPFWTIHPLYCDGLSIVNVTVRNPHDAPNTDGIDVDSCVNVLIEGCRIAVGDDGIALKSGSGADGLRVNRPTAFVTVRDCTVGDGHGGIVIGSETAAGVHDVLAERCVFRSTDRGIRVKTRRGRGGVIENLEFRELRMENNLCPVVINMYYRCGARLEDGLFSDRALPVTDATPAIRNVRIADVTATGCRASAGFIAGLPESPVLNLSVERCRFAVDESSAEDTENADMYLGLKRAAGRGFRVLNAVEPRFDGVTVEGAGEPFLFG